MSLHSFERNLRDPRNPRSRIGRAPKTSKLRLANRMTEASGRGMSTGLIAPSKRRASRRPSAVSSRKGKRRRPTAKLELDAEEVALHAAISSAVARDIDLPRSL